MARVEVTTAPALELLVMSKGVGGKEPVSRDNYTAVMAARGQSALQETPESHSGTEGPGADPARSEEPSEHGPAARREEESAGPPSADQGAAVTTGRHIAGPQGDGPSPGGGGGRRAAGEGHTAEAEEGHAAEAEEGHAAAAEEGHAAEAEEGHAAEAAEEGHAAEAAAGEGHAAAAAGGADREEKAEEPESDDARQTDTEAQIELEAQKQAHWRSPEFPEFPEALYELLCTMQEGRRLNDQRCSFRLKAGVPRRRCQSVPNTTKPARRVIFSSVTSLQQEEFFEQVAVAQARRLDDQRSELQSPLLPPSSKIKGRSFRGSLRQLSIHRKPSPPAPVPKDDLYTMILNTQAQGRLEDQRSRAPGPMDDEDFFSLLLKVQGGRMEEQRTEFPQLLLLT